MVLLSLVPVVVSQIVSRYVQILRGANLRRRWMSCLSRSLRPLRTRKILNRPAPFAEFGTEFRTHALFCWIPLAFVLLNWAFVGGIPHCSAQDPVARQQMTIEYLKQRAAELSANSLADVVTLDDWKRERPRLKRQLLDMLGLDPYPTRTPLKVEITGTLTRTKYTIEKIVFQSLPGLYVTGNFYLPKKISRPLPTIVFIFPYF